MPEYIENAYRTRKKCEVLKASSPELVENFCSMQERLETWKREKNERTFCS